MFFQHLCTPALVYLIFGIITLIKNPLFMRVGNFNTKKLSNNVISFVISFANTILFAYILNYICKTNGETNSWYMFIFLYVLQLAFFLVMCGIMYFLSQRR